MLATASALVALQMELFVDGEARGTKLTAPCR